MQDLVLLDSGSTNTVCCNKSYISNMKMQNILTITINQTCEIPYFGTYWFNKDAITNIIILADPSN